MRALLQRVQSASVSVNGRHTGSIGHGLLVFLGVGCGDTLQDARYLARKTAALRIFDDAQNKMNLCVRDTAGAALVVSQFTLYGDCRAGRRPSFSSAAPPEQAEKLYREYITALRQEGVAVSTGAFQKTMQVSLINDGPATFLLDSRKLF